MASCACSSLAASNARTLEAVLRSQAQHNMCSAQGA